MVALDLITAALEHATVLGQGQAPAPEDQTFAFGRLNNLIDGWNADEGMLYQRPQASYVLTNGNAGPYTIGPSGGFAAPNNVRPVLIQAANITPAGTTLTLDLRIVSYAEWAEIDDKAATSVRPQVVFCDYAFPNANVYVWPTPVGAATLKLFSLYQLPLFVTLQDTVSFPPAYAEALEFDLAVTVGAAFGKQVPQMVLQKAVDAKTRVRTANLRALALVNQAVAAGQINPTQLPAGVQQQLAA